MWKVIKISGLTLGGVLLFPGILFANQIEYKNFTVYSREDLGAGIETISDDIEAAPATSEINDPTLEHDIFFGFDNTAFKIIPDIRWWIISRITGLAPALTYNTSLPPRFNDVITFRIPDVEN